MNDWNLIQTVIIFFGFLITIITFISRFATKDDIKTLECNLTKHFDEKLNLTHEIADSKIRDLDYRIRRIEERLNGVIEQSIEYHQTL